jgi:hypothetical protein
LRYAGEVGNNAFRKSFDDFTMLVSCGLEMTHLVKPRGIREIRQPSLHG